MYYKIVKSKVIMAILKLYFVVFILSSKNKIFKIILFKEFSVKFIKLF